MLRRTYRNLLVTEEWLGLNARCILLSRWLALIVIAQKSKEEEKVRKGARGVAVEVGWEVGWDEICSQCLAPVVEGEATNVKLWTEEKTKGKPSKTRQVDYVADRLSDVVDPLQSERGMKVLAVEPVEEHIQRTYLKEDIDLSK
jgi:hypothetical protein